MSREEDKPQGKKIARVFFSFSLPQKEEEEEKKASRMGRDIFRI